MKFQNLVIATKMSNKNLQQKAVLSYNSLSDHHCHPPKKESSGIWSFLSAIFEAKRRHIAPFFWVSSFKSKQKKCGIYNIYLLYTCLNIFDHTPIHISFPRGSSLWSCTIRKLYKLSSNICLASIGNLHQNCGQRDNETTPLLEGVPGARIVQVDKRTIESSNHFWAVLNSIHFNVPILLWHVFTTCRKNMGTPTPTTRPVH